jgi:hypothetical protein
MIARTIALLAVAGAIIAAGFGVGRGMRVAVDTLSEDDNGSVPTTTVRRTDVAIEVSARGELQGGGARPLIVPRAGVAELPITFLRNTGDLVNAGDVVATFDPSGQQYDLLEAEADLEEARQQQFKAEAEAFVALEKARLEVTTSQADLKVSELDQLGNSFLGSVEQRKKAIALEQARNRYEQAQVDLVHRDSAKQTGVDVQRAGVKEAQAKVDRNRETIAGLTLRAPTSGYVQLAENTNGLTVLFYGMQVPSFQLGDSARPGQMVAQIPDMSGWEVSTQIPETDRRSSPPARVPSSVPRRCRGGNSKATSVFSEGLPEARGTARSTVGFRSMMPMTDCGRD